MAPSPSRRASGLAARGRLDAMPDRIDARDWFYRPGLAAPPDMLVNLHRVPKVLDQGQEGACTGFALAAVINFLLARRAGTLPAARLVSPHMLYEMARRYDEWPGEAYEGSSARGAMKGWVRHGVCPDGKWRSAGAGIEGLTRDLAELARTAPGGAFYRVAHREIRDMHAALCETGILYATLMVHDGWDEPGTVRDGRGRLVRDAEGRPRRAAVTLTHEVEGRPRQVRLPVISRWNRAESGHAVALVGYTREGFIVQNSWGEDWGNGGFALLPYEDFMLHATDVWVAQLGVQVSLDLWAKGEVGDTDKGLARAGKAIPLEDIRPYVVDVGNNGKLSAHGDYWTTEEEVERLFHDTIPNAAKDWEKRRVLLYLHGGLNSEAATARRVVAMKQPLLDNGIYPLHVMWESGAAETLRHIVEDIFTARDDRAGWLGRLREGAREAWDRTLELTAARPGSLMWEEMKENAALSSSHPAGTGAMQVIAKHVAAALAATRPAERAKWELHVVAHSAGAIYAAHALGLILGAGIPLRSLHLLAPAITVGLFEEKILPLVASGACPMPHTYVLGDAAERDDSVGIYRKSLLYLVSNAFEPARGTPLLGMERFAAALAPEVAARVHPQLVVAGRGSPLRSASSTHGGFDNDPRTMNDVLANILGAPPARPFDRRDLDYDRSWWSVLRPR
ncbi:C1 family peptidase [Falsiroseomonas sp. CW058]|uniref:C1 family peptidase n=1 Tax=Falsiroseomonas sp. CW058 TaxID=3388664 RepID=UPI003D31335E